VQCQVPRHGLSLCVCRFVPLLLPGDLGDFYFQCFSPFKLDEITIKLQIEPKPLQPKEGDNKRECGIKPRHVDVRGIVASLRLTLAVRTPNDRERKYISKMEVRDFFFDTVRHLGSSTAANWVSFDLNVSCSSC